MAGSPQTLSLDDRRRVASWAAECAEAVLHLFELECPTDLRVRAAIQQARAFASGELAVGMAIRRRGGDAGAAAGSAPTAWAKAAASAAEQAAACAHMGAHALGAAGYAAVAIAMSAEDHQRDGVLSEVCLRQVDSMTDDVARPLASLPVLGENRSGPLAAGRLSSGRVGQAIRILQAELRRAVDVSGEKPST